jgi:hypothetical protein
MRIVSCTINKIIIYNYYYGHDSLKVEKDLQYNVNINNLNYYCNNSWFTTIKLIQYKYQRNYINIKYKG